MIRTLRFAVLLGWLLATAPAWGADAPGTLTEHGAAVTQAARSSTVAEAYVVGRLSQQLGVAPNILQEEREQTKLEWGELLVARRLAEKAGLTLDEVVTELRAGQSWEAIAREHHVDVEALAMEVKASREIIEREAASAAAPAAKSSDKGGRTKSSGSGGLGRRGHGGGRGRH